MFTKPLVAMGAAIAASSSMTFAAIAQSLPPTVNIGGIDYEIEFKLGLFEDNVVELQAQPWYANNDFELATEAARQVFDCAAGSPFDRPICDTPFDAFGQVSSNTGFGGISPWFVYDVEAGVAAVAVGFSDLADGENVLGQISTDLTTLQSYAIATLASSESETETHIPEATSWVALLTVAGAAIAGSWIGRRN